ncbi:unnamed protein product [Lymnaea stagnalis]|uniref:Transmembrane protein 163 n=1 Tax=Lymnaea stagnalis TaxID=6523 RepID=A0AAV2H599_LYMST
MNDGEGFELGDLGGDQHKTGDTTRGDDSPLGGKGDKEGGHFGNCWEVTRVKCKGDNEKTSLIVTNGHLTPEETQRLLTAALVISWTSIIFSLGTGLAAVVLSLVGRSESLFAFGLDALLDSLSSVAVVWRFQGQVDCVYSLIRERKACIVIGVLFLVSAVSLIVKSVIAIIMETHEEKEVLLFDSFSLTCGVISVIIAGAKIYVGLKLGSRALYTDSIITLVGAASCFAGVAGLELYVEDTNLWYIDSVFGVICGLFLLLFGIRLLYTSMTQVCEVE